MRSFAVIAAVAGLVAANASGKPVMVTEVVTAYTTYCPSATQITHGGKTYTVTEATTLTITNCPCTITKPAETKVATSTYCPPAPTGPAPVPSGPAPVPSASQSVTVVKPSASATVPAPSATYTGAASKAQVAGGLLAALGLVAAAL